jgi:NodT family efflux transporter outer membrane factor (OMF) lipoprotein
MHQRRLKRSALLRVRWFSRAVRVLGCILIPSLTGCILTGYDKPDLALEIPDNYRAAHGDTAPPELDWWRGFHSRELTEYIEQAQTANFDIAVAIAQVEQADALVRISGATLLPTVDASATVTRSQTASTSSSSSTRAGAGLTSTLYNTNLNASYVLDVWGKNRAALLATEESAVASRFNREVVTLTTMTTVADTYFLVLGTQDRLRVANENVAAATRILNLVKQQFTVGTTSQLEVSQQEALLATVRASIPPLEVIVRQNKAALALLIGRAPENVDLHGGSLTRLAIPRVTPGLPSGILTQRPDVRQAETQLASSNYSVESARAAFFPTIQLTGQTGFESLALRSLFGPGAWFYTAAASLTQPVFDGFLLLGQLEQQLALQKQFLQAYRKSVISAFTDVEKALIAVEEFTRQERLQSQAVTSSRRAFQLSEAQLQAGTVNLITVLQTEQTLFTAEDTLAQVRLARFQAIIGLYQALGGGWPPKIEIAREAHERAVEVNPPGTVAEPSLNP